LEYLTQDLGKYFYGERITIKPFSSCRATHPSIDLALGLREKFNLTPKQIRKVTVKTTPEMSQLVAEPREAKIAPASVPAAQFSIQFTVAAALTRGDVFLKELEPPSLKDRDILDLASRVVVEPDPSLRTDFVLGRTIVEIETNGEAPLRGEIEMPLGSPFRPMTYEACAGKFMKSAAASVNPPDKSELEMLIDWVSHLEDLEDITAVIPLLAGKP
jgi:2-methylcitrate dehydratase PrpD